MMRNSLSPIKDLTFNSDSFAPAPIEQQFQEIINGLEGLIKGRDLNSGFGHLKENENAYLLSIEMPGVRKEDLDIQVGESQVVVEAQRKTLFEDGARESRKIFKSISIPSTIRRDKVQAQMQDGILYLALPKAEDQKSRKIKVSDAKDDFMKLFAENNKRASH